MTPARRTAMLILFGVAALVLAVLVLIISRRLESRLLAVLGLVGGAAMVVVALPDARNGSNGTHRSG